MNCCATRIGAERSRYRTRRRSPGSAVTRPASASSARCLAIAWRVIGSWPARSVAVAGPPEASAARMARRLGSPKATKTCSAIASTSGCIEVVDEFAKLARPPLGVTVVGRAVGTLGKLREAGLDHGQPRAGPGRLQRELHVGAARILLRQAEDVPGEAERPWLLHPFHPHLRTVAAVPLHRGRAAQAQVDLRFLAEPGTQPLGRGERRPYLGRRVRDLDGPLDAIGEP